MTAPRTLRSANTALLVLAVAAVAVVAACGDDDGPDPTVVVTGGGTQVVETVPRKDVLIAAIRHVAELRPRPDDGVAIVYVVAVGEHGIGAGDQADVASALRDEVDVRFSDAREEAIDESAEGAPVLDGGVLMLVGDLSEQVDPVSVAIQVYYDESDRSKAIFTLAIEPAGGTAPDDSTVWRVTATSLVPLDAPT